MAQTPEPQGIEIYSPSGIQSFTQMIDAALQADVVIVGEYHDSATSHQWQMQILKALQQAQPKRWAVGVEWLPVTSQSAVADYLADKLNDFSFIRASDYVQRWGFDYRLTNPVLAFCKAEGLELLALNAPKEITRQVSQKGLASLNETQRALFPNPLLPQSQQYLDFLNDFFTQSNIAAEKIPRMREVQAIWDQTMALQATHFLQKHPQQKLLVFTGMVHATGGQGIQHALQQLTPKAKIFNIGHGEFDEDQIKHFDAYAVLPERHLPPLLSLGVTLDTQQEGVVIDSIQAGSLAQRLGLQPGDRLVRLGDYDLPDYAALKAALWLTPTNKPSTLAWYRTDAILDIALPYKVAITPDK